MKVKKEENIATLIASKKDDFCPHVDKLMEVVDNQNGYYVKIFSHSSCHADKIFNLDYGDLEMLSLIHKKTGMK